METINIKIIKSSEDVIIQSSEGQQIQIFNSNKELKASDVIAFLRYSKEKKYTLEPLDEDLNNDKNVISIYEIFNEIIKKINPVEDNG